MKTWLKVLLIVLFFGIPAFFLGPVIWPMSPDFPTPTPAQLPYFILLSVFDSLAFGLGMAFVLFGLPVVRRMAHGSGTLAWALYISISFLLVSWWPHINLHNHVGFDLQGLLKLDYGFHTPLIISGAIVAYGFFKMFHQVSDKSEIVVPTVKERMSING